jgi:hypothetical protein
MFENRTDGPEQADPGRNYGGQTPFGQAWAWASAETKANPETAAKVRKA